MKEKTMNISTKGTYNVDPNLRRRDIGTPHETITDDAPLAADARAALARDEGLVREVLGLVGVDYDALIRMDGQSPYSLAVEAKPALVRDILRDERPVLAALRVAMGFKPMAEFQGKYGKEPDAIKAKIREEVMAEVGRDKPPAEEKTPTKAATGPLFSSRYGAGATRAPQAAALGMGDIFKR